MKITCYNELMLDKVCTELYTMLGEKKAINISYDEYHKPKSRKQLGFFFAAICEAVVDFYHQQGLEEWTTNAVKELFYAAVSPKRKMVKFNGTVYDYPLRMSEMDMKQMSEFIDNVLNLIERAPCFKHLILTPDVRHCWVHNITKEELKDLKNPNIRKCPEYLEYRRKQCCIVCGQFGCEAHHLREVEEAGVARKADDWQTISLCREHHRLYHIKGKEWLEEQIGWILRYMTLEEFCACCFQRWLAGLR